MKTKATGLQAGAMCSALLAAILAAAPALAQPQTANNAPPAERYLVSPGGVDMRSGRYVYSQTDLAIGGESGGLALTRSLPQLVAGHANPFANFSHNLDMLLTEKRIDIFANEFSHEPGRPDFQMEVGFGGLAQTFRGYGIPGHGLDQISRAGFGQLSYTGDRESGTAIYTFTTGDGTVAVFRPINSADCSTALRCAYVAQVTEPDGTLLTFAYDNQGAPNTTRLRRVASSRGHALLLEYSGPHVIKACVLNVALAAAPADNVCPGDALATASYGYTALSGEARLAAAVDPGGQTWGFTYPALGQTEFVRPGEAASWLTNSALGLMDEEGLVTEAVTAQSFADGSSYSYSYDASPIVPGQASKLAGGSYTDALGHTTVLEFAFPPVPRPGQGGGNVPEDGEGPWPETYQMTPGPTRIVDPLGRVTLIDYCDPNAMANLPGLNRCIVSPMPVSVTDPEGIKTELVTDFYSRNVLQRTQIARPGTGLANLVTHATFSCVPATARYCNKPLTTTDAMGNVTDYAYAPEHGGLLAETLPAPAPGAPRPQTRHIYAQRQARTADGAAAGPPIWVRTASSLCRTSAATGNPAAPCASANDETRTTFLYGPGTGPNNLLLVGQEVSDGTAILRTCYGYDTRGRKISETQPNAALAACSAAAPAAAAPFTASTRYDAMGRVTGTISPDPDTVGSGNPFLAVRNSYDPAGRPIKVETGTLSAWQSEAVAPAAWSGFNVVRTLETSYDVMGRKTREFVREGAAGAVRTVTQMSYDAVGRLECTAVRMNPAAFGALPASACTPGTAGSDGPDRISRNVYDAAGQRLQLREGVGSPDEGAEATWAYNLNGQVTQVIDGNGNRAALSYDGHGRQDRWTFPSTTRPPAYDDATQASALETAGAVNPGDYEEYGYDLIGNRTSLRKRDNSVIAYQYDNLNRMIVKVVPERAGLDPAHSRDVHYGYDLRGLQLFARFDSASGEGITNSYDGFGRLKTHINNMGGTSRLLFYTWDPAGNRIDIAHPDGLWFSTNYDALGRPTYLSGNGNTGIAFAHYAEHGGLWAINRHHPATWAVVAQTFLAYDGIQRPATLSHSPGGGAVAWSYARNPAGQLSSIARDNDNYAWTGHYAVERAYVTDGLNRYSAAGPPANPTQGANFTYDLNGNLISDGSRTYGYDVENRLVSASPNVTLTYDPLGRLFQLVVNGAVTTTFLYDGDALVGEYNGAGTLTRRYVHGVGADVPMASYADATLANPTHLFADHQGSIVAHADANGTVTAINRYDEYGIPAAGNVGRFQYTGQIWLPELGMYHYKSRVYSPYLGRMVQTDSVGYEGGINLYAYVGNDPLNLIDPTGARSYAAARPLDSNILGGVRMGHSYNVTHARRIGDPQARIHSFGELRNGKMGNVSNAARASDFSSTTAASDREHWVSLGRDSNNVSSINAPDDVVAGVVAAVREDQDYSVVPGLNPFGSSVNSNAAALAVADKATQISSGNPEEGFQLDNRTLALPGMNERGRVKFDERRLPRR